MKSMPCPLACMAAVLCLYAQTATPAIADELTVIQAKQLHLGTGEVLSPGSVAVRDGKIVEVGAAVEAGNANVISVHTLIPGLIDACSQAGLSGQSDERTDETTPDLQVIDVVDWTDRAFQEQVADGCTTVNVVPGTENVISGQSAVVKTSGTGENRVITDSSGLWLAMCRDPTSGNRSRSRPDSIYVRQPTNRMGVVWLLRSTFHAAGAESSAASPLNAVLDDKANAFCVSRTHYDIEALLDVAKEFAFRPIVVGGHEAWRVADLLAERDITVVLHKMTPGAERGTEGTRLCADIARRMHDRDITFCLSQGDLLTQAQHAVAMGLPLDAAIRAITLTPAKVLQIDDRVGSIAVGKDADFVALNGDALQFTSAIGWVMIDGKVQFQQEIN